MEYQRVTKPAQKEPPKTVSSPLRQTSLNHVAVHSLREHQSAIGNQAEINMPRSQNTQIDTSTQAAIEPRFGHDFSRIPIHSTQIGMPQNNRRVSQPGNAIAATSPEASPHVQSGLSGGQPLDTATRAFMEPRFGYDFSQVRVHTDERAAESARAVNALAYTAGRDVVFDTGQYMPQSSVGRRLIAHELTHVVQQQSTPAVPQEKLRISSPSDSAERSADAAARAVTAPDNSLYRSSALQIRDQLRTSPVPHPTIQRAVKTWGGEYDTDKYELSKVAGVDGVNIDLRFKPNKHVDAELIGMTQTARSLQKGGPVPAKTFVSGKAEEAAYEAYRIPKGDPSAGTKIDQLVKYKNPLYATGATGAKDTLSTTPTSKGWGQHGWHYTDKAGKLQKQDALLKDTPALSSALKGSSQVFESTALAIKGVQEGTFYGSVQWGWEKDAAGKVNKLPLKLVSNDVPSPVFSKATELWNKGKTSKGEATIDLPTTVGKYTNTQGVWLVSNPSHYKTTIIGMLAKNTRLEVTDKGTAKPFNKAADADKWWKVTIVDGTHIGKVGWVMQADLSDTKTK